MLMPQHLLEHSSFINASAQRLPYVPFNPTDAGYAMYRCPYVWLRSHKEEYLQAQSKNEDYPLHLKKTMDWKNSNVFLWEVVDEILSMTTKPENPFEIDFAILDQLPLEEAIMLINSLLLFLKAIWVQASPSITYSSKIYQDIQKLESLYLDLTYKTTSSIKEMETQ
ncbi:hypothetical protein A0J61_00451 [Choanephora cucurbitarum]|uniref:DUF7886 domain-containing protein n=1 Tax=Choanephora cucurbitarum TaxID=101091 RepID=A0A1C7NQR0_9FUNG|nr:hypothetical protein A0J61_00451 [Choanephora cucurbitarum]